MNKFFLFGSLFISNIFLLTQAEECKPVTTAENFDLEVYVSKPWYVHQQAVNSYSPIESNYCTKAEYTIRERPTIWGHTVDVYNTAQYENGFQIEANLCAYQIADDSKLQVGPCFLPKLFTGPYWIVAYNEEEGYALRSAGQPTVVGEDGLCLTGTPPSFSDGGLWIFSRSQDRNETLVDHVRGIAEEAGFSVAPLNDVNQTSCDVCADTVGDFDVGFGREKDCAWVGSAFWRCRFFAAECPETCGIVSKKFSSVK